jgi:hypothetical protein
MPDDDKDKKQQSMGELAALMYEDTEWQPPAGLTMKQTIDLWTEQRFPGVHARGQAKRLHVEGVQAIDAKMKEFDKKVEAENAARVRQRALEEIQRDPDLRITEAEIPEVEKVMAERFIGNYKDAALLYRHSQRLAAPRATQSLAMEVPGLDGAGGEETAWLKPAFSNLGDRGVLDRITKRRVDQIRQDFAAGRGSRWQE